MSKRLVAALVGAGSGGSGSSSSIQLLSVDATSTEATIPQSYIQLSGSGEVESRNKATNYGDDPFNDDFNWWLDFPTTQPPTSTYEFKWVKTSGSGTPTCNGGAIAQNVWITIVQSSQYEWLLNSAPANSVSDAFITVHLREKADVSTEITGNWSFTNTDTV